MASFKVRRKVYAQGGLKVGAQGNDVSELLFGTVSACVPAISASGDFDSGSIGITNLNEGAKVFILGTNAPHGLLVYSACATGAGEVTASYALSTGEAGDASTISFQYLALN